MWINITPCIKFLSRLIFKLKHYKMVKKIKTCKNNVKIIEIKVILTKCLENLVKNKNRHSVNMNLGQQDEKSMIKVLYLIGFKIKNAFK